jgi:hypothetical protein
MRKSLELAYGVCLFGVAVVLSLAIAAMGKRGGNL